MRYCPLKVIVTLNVLCLLLAGVVVCLVPRLQERCGALERRADALAIENERLRVENVELMRERNKVQRDCIETINKIYGAKK